MMKARGALAVTALSALLLGGLVGPAMAQSSAERCGPYTGVTCPDPKEPEQPDVEVVPPEEEPVVEPEQPDVEVVPPEEEPPEVEGELITDPDPPETESPVDEDDEAVAAPDEPRVLGTVLARTGAEAWLLSLVGVLLLGGGLAVLATRRHRAANPMDH